MNWTKALAVAEILSSVAIIATLIYLAIQTEQNTETLQANSRDSVLETDIQHLYRIVDDADIWFSYTKPDLDDRERVRLFHFLSAYVRIHERNWLQWDSGALDDIAWQAYRRSLMSTLSYSQPRRWWTYFSAGVALNADFVAYVDAALSNQPNHGGDVILRAFD